MDRRQLSLAWVAVGAWWSSSCAPSGFSDASQLNTVRILASSTDEPYVAPGDTVHVHVLAYDARSTDARGEPMAVTWVPLVCKDPASDAYYACFPQFAALAGTADGGVGAVEGGVADGGVGTGEGGVLDGGVATGEGGVVDGGVATGEGGVLDGGVATGESGVGEGGAGEQTGAAGCVSEAGVPLPGSWDHAFTVPADIVTAHPAVAGAGPYGLAFFFNIACAGRVEYVPPDPSNPNPQKAPIGCFDDAGARLGPDDYVIGYTRVFAHQQPDGGYYTNANPRITGVDSPPRTLAVQGTAPALVVESPLAVRCTAMQCPRVKLGPLVPADSWEVNPLNVDSQGRARHEEIWADYYATFGGFSSTSRLIYEPSSGAIADPDTNFLPPYLGSTDAHDGAIFIVVHDDRGGAAWVTLPTHVCSDGNDPACQPGCPGF